MSKTKVKIEAYCNNCQRKTNHSVLFQHLFPKVVELFSKNSNGYIKDKFYSIFITNYLFLECLGCETPSILVQEYNPTKTDEDYIKMLKSQLIKEKVEIEIKPVNEFSFPPQRSRKKPDWINELPVELMKLFLEVYSALHQGLIRLTTMGSRTILDTIITNKICDRGTFKNKLKEFMDCGYINKVQHDLIEVALEVGNAATHRGFKPSEEELYTILDIIENIVQQDILFYKASKVKKVIPPKS